VGNQVAVIASGRNQNYHNQQNPPPRREDATFLAIHSHTGFDQSRARGLLYTSELYISSAPLRYREGASSGSPDFGQRRATLFFKYRRGTSVHTAAHKTTQRTHLTSFGLFRPGRSRNSPGVASSLAACNDEIEG
jgi:hypothetical protein